MNAAIIGSIIRWVAALISGTAIGAALIAAGAFDQSTIEAIINHVTTIVTSAVALGTLVWSIYQKVKVAKKLNAAIVAPAAELPK